MDPQQMQMYQQQMMMQQAMQMQMMQQQPGWGAPTYVLPHGAQGGAPAAQMHTHTTSGSSLPGVIWQQKASGARGPEVVQATSRDDDVAAMVAAAS